MILFRKIRFKNFLSTGDKFIEIALDKSDTTLIVGQNGSGKSTMLDAISFALFGKPHRNINKPQLVNSINGKSCRVEVEFDIGNSKYKVVRGIKPVKFEIYRDGTLLNQNSHNKEYQKILEQNILKLNHKSFHQVVVLGSSSFIPFMQLAAHHRRDVIEDLLDIGVFSKMNALLKERTAVLKEKLNQVQHSIAINETKTEAQKKYIRDISKMNHDAKQERESDIQKYLSEIDDLHQKTAESQKVISENSLGLQDKMDLARDALYELNSRESEINNKIKSLVKESKFYEDNQNCPTCEQEIDEGLKEKKLSEAKTTATELQSDISEIAEKRIEANSELEMWSEVVDENNKLLAEIDRNNSRVTALKEVIDELQEYIDSLSDQHSDLSKANDDYDELVKEYHELMGNKNSLSDQSSYNTVIAEMLKDTGIKTKIVNQYLPVINSLANQYLQTLDFYVHFDLDGAFKETIRSRHRDMFTYESFSEGEKQRIDLALLFTWRQVAKMKNSVATNLLILDETFDSSLDEAGVENLMKIINTLDKGTNVFIISHKGEMLDGKFKSKVEFWKEKNFTRMKAA
jgi:DNA repair exonuclease SbcCD ATPase subunit